MSPKARAIIAELLERDLQKAKTLPVYYCTSQPMADAGTKAGLRTAMTQKIPAIEWYLPPASMSDQDFEDIARCYLMARGYSISGPSKKQDETSV